MNYYDVLGIPKTASSNDIKSAYRCLARKYHPDKQTINSEKITFEMINDAYNVLIEPDSRKKYDECLLFKKSSPLICNITISLDEAYYGTTIKIPISRTVFCRAEVAEKNILEYSRYDQKTNKWAMNSGCKKTHQTTNYEFVIQRGIFSGQKITLENCGNYNEGEHPGDIEININILPHKLARVGNDLQCIKVISIKQALGIDPIFVQKFDKIICIKKILTTILLRIESEGMPYNVGAAYGETLYGDLLVQFIILPYELLQITGLLIKK